MSNGNCDGQGQSAPSCQQSATCQATVDQQVAAQTQRDNATTAALAAAAKARADAEAKAKADAAAAAAHRHCSWYDVACQVEVHAAAIEEVALAVVVVAAVIAICVVAPEVAIAAAGAFGEVALGGATLEMAAVAGVAAGISTAAESAGFGGVALGAALVANIAGASHGVGGGGGASRAVGGWRSGDGVGGGARGGGSSSRPDGQTVFAGHGGWSIFNGWTRIPKGTSLATYGKTGATISDYDGFRVENGDSSLEPVRVYGPGSFIRNLTLYPGGGLTIMSGSTTVGSPTSLSSLLEQDMGMCHWAACLGRN
jgi:hypothetical protein